MSNNIDITIGSNLSRLRTVAGFSQKTFGNACTPAISSQQVSKYELGENAATGARILDFAAVLRCSPRDLLEGVGTGAAFERGGRGDHKLMRDYQTLPEHQQAAVRELVHSMIKEPTA